MRRTTALLAAAAAAALVLGPLAAMADAGTVNGVGTGSVSSTVLGVALGSNGDVLDVRVLGDDGLSTIDPTKGTPVSSETFRPLSIASKAVPAVALTVPAIATTSSGTEDRKSVQPTLPNVPAFSGSLNAVLSSIVDASGARSGLQAGLANLKVAGGLVTVPTGVVQVATSAAKGSATGNRTITIPDVRVLDLSALLDGLGLQLTDLSVNQLLALLKSLGLTIQNLADPAGAITQLNGAINTLSTQTGTLTASLCNTVDGLLSGPLGGVTGVVGGAVSNLQTTVGTVVGTLPVAPPSPPAPGTPTVLDPVKTLIPTLPLGLHTSALADGFSCSNLLGATVKDLLDKVDSTLATVLDSVLATVASTPLLEVKDINVGLVATAADTVGNSVADVTASIGQVKVGALAVPGISGLDLTAPAAQITQATSMIQGAVNNVLASINANLANLVKVDVLKIDKGVSAANGYTNATSTVTALRATLTPPATPLTTSALLDLSGTPVSTLLTSISSTVPTLSPLMGQLEATLGGIQALRAPSVVTVGALSAAAAFRPVTAATPGIGAPTTSGDLPRTGGDAALPAMVAVTLGGIAFALRRTLRAAKIDR